MFCLSARNECNGPFELYIPITMSDTLAPEDMEMMQDILSPDHKQLVFIKFLNHKFQRQFSNFLFFHSGLI